MQLVGSCPTTTGSLELRMRPQYVVQCNGKKMERSSRSMAGSLGEPWLMLVKLLWHVTPASVTCRVCGL